MQKFGSGLWRWVKRLIATVLLPWALKITVKIADYVVGDTVAAKIHTWESGEGLEAFVAKILYYLANYPMRSTLFATCAVLAVSAIASAIASWRDDDRKESRGFEVTPLKDKKSNIVRGIKVHLEVMTPGLRMLWMDRTFLFMHCRVVSPVKTTSIIRVGATLKTSDGKVWLCDCLDDLSQWLLCPDKGADVELESQSLIARFRQSPLVAEVQQGGWLGIQVPFAPTKERLDAITQITITMIDGKEEKHTTKFRSPWPRDERTLIVAKHVRTSNAEW